MTKNDLILLFSTNFPWISEVRVKDSPDRLGEVFILGNTSHNGPRSYREIYELLEHEAPVGITYHVLLQPMNRLEGWEIVRR